MAGYPSVFIPGDAEGVNFKGEQVASFAAVSDSATNGLQQWEVKLHRRVIGSYLLQATYQVLTPEQAREVLVRGVEASGVNLQRGFVIAIDYGYPRSQFRESLQVRAEHRLLYSPVE